MARFRQRRPRTSWRPSAQDSSPDAGQDSSIDKGCSSSSFAQLSQFPNGAVRRFHEAHSTRARWISRVGYRLLLKRNEVFRSTRRRHTLIRQLLRTRFHNIAQVPHDLDRLADLRFADGDAEGRCEQP
jgi:hypothetical protein